ncbi:MAG: NADH-ubiquinone/plastoquinone oxidoreductase chain 3 [Acidimicrobiia bacterium]|nr:NADH-ubiquinone/plastoquinone oxidoreductase chain 3 [Acidimicrobiia bacterium]MYC57696.1 NADH-ubiquinone/plastoquinone oxidoreductase chain 3 [Acidimicrobiia bacterium]MYG93600.1 NADH-ubiquinone/plastoquinone oxidoreductase chain 3 [Acidimicrobiia bacterium]MYI30895.1 NADH-ubiquinone/plastoquinone oxidoreductase chain 3 [Acidimicrobiia bacterium]
MTAQYLPIVVLGVLAVLFAVLSIGASRLLAPRQQTRVKLQPYECGVGTSTEAPERFGVRFFLIAMIFIVFDIEIIFLYPWAVSYRELGVFGLVAMGVFALAVFESFVYLIGNGALDWGTAQRFRKRDSQVSSSRTSASTVRYVGLDGRNLPVSTEPLAPIEPA